MLPEKLEYQISIAHADSAQASSKHANLMLVCYKLSVHGQTDGTSAAQNGSFLELAGMKPPAKK